MEALSWALGGPLSMDDYSFNRRPVSPRDTGQVSSSVSEGGSPGYSESFNTTLKFISEMLMEEEDLERKSMALKDSLALQAAEKSLYDVIGQNYPSIPSSSLSSPNNKYTDGGESGPSCVTASLLLNSKNTFAESFFPSEPRGKRNHFGEEDEGDDRTERQINKQSAVYADETPPTEMFDKVLLYNEQYSLDKSVRKLRLSENHAKGFRKTSRTKRQDNINNSDMVDLWTLLTQCAQAVASFDQRAAVELIKQIRQYSSPEGDSIERMAHYFVNSLEARLTGTKMASYSPTVSCAEYSSSDILRAHQLYITASPFLRMSFCFANRMIRKLARKAKSIHVIDFGIQYGFQWPGFIQSLSKTPGGPPKLTITGVELPQPGFRPLEQVGESMRRLANYCERFNVLCECNVISKKWETIRLEDFKLKDDEFIAVNCIYRMRHIPDETVVMNNPRDSVLNLMRKINPDVFIHGVCNGTYNAPFFLTRFREALFHFSGLFDMLDSTTPRGDEYRMKFEKAIYGRDILNVVACEGAERVERPETYKQWQVRNTRAGFRQVALDPQVFESVKNTVVSNYNKDFVVEQHGQWMVQGWKGRRAFAISCWKPA